MLNGEFTVNSKTWYLDEQLWLFSCMELNHLVPLLNSKPWSYRLKIEQQPLIADWSNWLIVPTETYIEVEKQGPYPARQIEWIDINPIEIKNNGRLVPATETDHSEQVIQLLKDCFFPVIQDSGVFRIFIS